MSVVFPVETSDRYERYTLTAGQTVVAVPFPFQDNADLVIARISTTGVTAVLAEPADYTLIGAGMPSGGYLTLEAPGAAGEECEISGRVVLDRLTSVVRAGKFSSKALDDDFDRLILALQEHRRDIDVSWKSPFGTDGGTITPGADGTLATFSGGQLVGLPLLAGGDFTILDVDQGGTGSGTKPGAANSLEVVSFGAAQTLTGPQQAQALENLGVSGFIQTLCTAADQDDAKDTLGLDEATLDARYMRDATNWRFA